MAKTLYWLVRGDEPAALVEGAAERDSWVRVHGYTELPAEPADDQQVYVVNETTGGRGVLPYGAVRSGGWTGLGWQFAGPPDPVDLTKDPALVDQPAPAKSNAAPAAARKEG